MAEDYEKKTGPVVSVLIPTFNRPQYLYKALASVLQQSYSSLEVIVVNDGGEDVGGIVNSFHDPRLVFINRKENCGKAFSLNEALKQAHGKYVAYLDDDDLYYPRHIETLVDVLENRTDCHAAYSDFYKVYCKVSSDGSRQVLSKVVEVSRDFDRFFMLYFNHVLHVCLMHRRDLLEKTGPYNEKLNILIDWDMTRRLVFFTDFYHVYEVTGEYYHPMGECDRISLQQRKDKNKYARNVLTIRTTRPPKPWSKVKDLSIIFDGEQLNLQTGRTILSIWKHTFYPYEIYLPLSESDLNKLNTDMPNLVVVPVAASLSQAKRIDSALKQCNGEYIAIVPSGFPITDMWIENSIYALINSPVDCHGFELVGSTSKLWAAVVRKDSLLFALSSFPDLPVRESLKAARMVLRKPRYEELPFQFDDLLKQARLAEKNGNCLEAAEMFEYIANHHQNELWMKKLAAKAFFNAGNHLRATELSSEINDERPTVDTLLMEAKVKRENKNYDSAIELLKTAERVLTGEVEY
jgi:glycosyltransferase involved in cell wall biosynthesis